jgi:hypothetical protein
MEQELKKIACFFVCCKVERMKMECMERFAISTFESLLNMISQTHVLRKFRYCMVVRVNE